MMNGCDEGIQFGLKEYVECARKDPALRDSLWLWYHVKFVEMLQFTVDGEGHEWKCGKGMKVNQKISLSPSLMETFLIRT